MYLIIILTIEINNDNNKNDIVWLILSLFFFSQSAAMCRSTWRKEVIIYVLHSFKCYLHENLDLVIIFFTLLQKKIYLKRYILANNIIVLLFPIATICRSTWRKEVIIYILHSFKSHKCENLILTHFCSRRPYWKNKLYNY